ncbi:hypothetical protein RI054_12g61430 [Pseudoscourfieldia marina]
MLNTFPPPSMLPNSRPSSPPCPYHPRSAQEEKAKVAKELKKKRKPLKIAILFHVLDEVKYKPILDTIELNADKARSSSMAYVQLFQTAREQLRTARISAERFRYLSGLLDDKMAQVSLLP